jgi:hypothetical protein
VTDREPGPVYMDVIGIEDPGLMRVNVRGVVPVDGARPAGDAVAGQCLTADRTEVQLHRRGGVLAPKISSGLFDYVFEQCRCDGPKGRSRAYLHDATNASLG